MPDDPIFIIGTERSGSNLLRLILDAHPRIAVAHPTHAVHYFAPLEATYGDLAQDEPFTRLVDDVLHLLRVHIHPWDVPIQRERVLREARPRDILGITAALYDQYREARGKARWGCKSTFMVDHVDRARAAFPGARFVLLVRDPRDVAVSSRRSVFSPFHPALTARLWAAQQAEGLRQLDALGPAVVHLLRYEDLLSDPEGAVRQLCAFLEEDFHGDMLRFHEGREARRTASLSRSWANTGRPVLAGNAGRFRQDLSPEEVRLVESTCAEGMARLGYEFTEEQQIQPVDETPLMWRVKDLGWRIQAELRSMREDRNHWRRWQRDAFVAWTRLRHHS